jgi:hypothetical protein
MKSPTLTTLLDLIQTVNQYATSDDEVVATVTYLINSNKVRLCGTFAGAKIELTAPTYQTLPRSRYTTNFARKTVVSAA